MSVMRNSRSWLSDDEAARLAEYAAAAVGDIVEVGTYRGGTTEMLVRVAPDTVAVWTIDSYMDWACAASQLDYDPKRIYHGYLRGYGNAFVVVSDSRNAGRWWRRPIGLLFIDGGHGYDDASQDFVLWSQWVIADGVVAIHDYASYQPGVVRAVDEIIADGEWCMVELVDTMAFLRRRQAA